MYGRSPWVPLGILAVLFVPARSIAQTPPAGSAHVQGDDNLGEKNRSAAYAQGLDLARAGRWSEAAERFREAVAIRSSPNALLALATAEEQSGRLAMAWRTFQKGLADARTAGQGDDATLAQQGLRALDRRVPRLRIVASGAAGAARATIDGESVPIGHLVEVDPGPHTIVVSADAVSPQSTRLVVAEGERRDVSVELVAQPAATPAPQAPPPRPTPPDESHTGPASPPAGDQVESPVPWALVMLGAAGAGVAGVGAYFDLHGLSEHNALASCTGCTQQNVDSAKRDMWIGTGLLWTGGAALATAAVLYVIRLSAPHSRAATFFKPAVVGAGGDFAMTF